MLNIKSEQKMKRTFYDGFVSVAITIGIMLVVTTVCIGLTTAFSFADTQQVAITGSENGVVASTEKVAGDSRTVGNYVLDFHTISSTRAYASVQAASSGSADYITCTIVLQSAPLGSDNYTTVANSKVSRTVTDTNSMLLSTYYTISSNKDYRIKIQMTDEINGIRTTVTDYKDLVR